MERDLISVVIPVYNVQQYVEKCVDSVVSQTYNYTEILLVNDGSTDNSGKICDELAAKDKRIFVIHQENKGISEARNIGTAKAKGKYIFYLDSDDYITPDCLENLHQAIVKYGAEIAQGNFYYNYPNRLIYNNRLNGEDIVITRDEAMDLLIQNEIIKTHAWMKLIRSDIAKKHPFPKGKYHEDIFWTYRIIHECETYVALAKPMHYYLQRPDSIMGTFSIKQLQWLEGIDYRIQFIKENYPTLQDDAIKYFDKLLKTHASKVRNLKRSERKIYDNTIKQYEAKYAFTPYKKRLRHAPLLAPFVPFLVKIKYKILKPKAATSINSNIIRINKVV